jgi:hypothetical protein
MISNTLKGKSEWDTTEQNNCCIPKGSTLLIEATTGYGPEPIHTTSFPEILFNITLQPPPKYCKSFVTPISASCPIPHYVISSIPYLCHPSDNV